LLDFLRVFGAKPDLLLCCAVYAGMSFSPLVAAGFGLFAGGLKDVLGADSWGLNTFFFCLWSFFIAQLSRKAPTDEKMLRALLAAAVALLQNSICAAAVMSAGIAVSAGIIARNVIFGSAYTAAVFPLFFRLNKIIKTES
jgi:rod shape-determining protein MreD